MIPNKTLPYVIFTCGLLSACNVDSSFSFYPGILLMLIACLIWERQLEHKKN